MMRDAHQRRTLLPISLSASSLKALPADAA
jgi:hypothetical protein